MHEKSQWAQKVVHKTQDGNKSYRTIIDRSYNRQKLQKTVDFKWIFNDKRIS